MTGNRKEMNNFMLLFYLTVNLAKDRKIAQDNEWDHKVENQLRELVERKMAIRRMILRR